MRLKALSYTLIFYAIGWLLFCKESENIGIPSKLQ